MRGCPPCHPPTCTPILSVLSCASEALADASSIAPAASVVIIRFMLSPLCFGLPAGGLYRPGAAAGFCLPSERHAVAALQMQDLPRFVGRRDIETKSLDHPTDVGNLLGVGFGELAAA